MNAEPALREEDVDDAHVDEDMKRYEAAQRGTFVEHARVRTWLHSKDGDRPSPRPQPGD